MKEKIPMKEKSLLSLYIFEINLEEVISAINPSTVKYKKLPIYGAVQRDIAFSAPKEITVEELYKAIKKSADKNIFKGAKVFDIYEGENIEKGKNNPPDEVQLETIADVLSLDEQMRFELIDKAAAERGTVARDLVMALAKNKSLRQFIRDVNAGRCNLEMTQQSKR